MEAIRALIADTAEYARHDGWTAGPRAVIAGLEWGEMVPLGRPVEGPDGYELRDVADPRDARLAELGAQILAMAAAWQAERDAYATLLDAARAEGPRVPR